MTIKQPEQDGTPRAIVALAVTHDGETLTRTHFGSAEAYMLYRCDHQACKRERILRNTTSEERHDGDPAKASSVRTLLSQHNVSIVVARRFGPNIKRIRQSLIPVIALSESVDDTLHGVISLWDLIIEQSNMLPEKRWHIVLNRGNTSEAKGVKMSAKVNAQACRGCARCVDVCPVDAITMQNRLAIIDEEGCVSCGACVSECPVEAISLTE